MSRPIVDLQSVRETCRRGWNPVEGLRNRDLQIEPGAFVTLMDPSGSGTTTLINLVGGIEHFGQRDFSRRGWNRSGPSQPFRNCICRIFDIGRKELIVGIPAFTNRTRQREW